MQKISNDRYEDKDLNSLFEDLKDEVIDYVNKKFRYFKLYTFEKISIILSLIGLAIVVLILTIGMLFFGLLGIAFLIGEILNSFAGGFGILFGCMFLCLIFVVIFQKKIRRFLMNKAIILMRKIESDEEF